MTQPFYLIVHGLLMTANVLEFGDGLDEGGVLVQHLLHLLRVS